MEWNERERDGQLINRLFLLKFERPYVLTYFVSNMHAYRLLVVAINLFQHIILSAKNPPKNSSLI